MDKFWVVTDPKPTSTLGDCVFMTDAHGLVLQVRGGLGPDQNPTIHSVFYEALCDAKRRIFEMLDHARDLDAEIDAAIDAEEARLEAVRVGDRG